MKSFINNIIYSNQSIKEALIKLNSLKDNEGLTLFVINSTEQLLGTLTDGDVRRGLIEDKSVNDPVSIFMNSNFKYLLKSKFTLDEIQHYKQLDIELIPLLDEDRRIIRVINLKQKKSILPIDAVLMAGGKGTRLKPLTDNTPKPLLKIGDKPIIEHNIDRLNDYGVDNITITIKYLGNQLMEYFQNGEKKGLNIKYIEETSEPLGTMGSVSLIDHFTNNYILIMNSDLLTNIDFEDFFRDFLIKEADMMVATIPYHVNIPYAVVETNHDRILSFKEKPTYTYYSNAGIYILKREIIDRIPKNKFYNATDLMEDMINTSLKVSYYPILDYWLDIGKFEDFKKAQEDIKHIKL